jgi:AraC-like DNA-binding protein
MAKQTHLLEAISRIAEGESIATIAQDLGYNNQSASIAMFNKDAGKTSKKYFDVD